MSPASILDLSLEHLQADKHEHAIGVKFDLDMIQPLIAALSLEHVADEMVDDAPVIPTLPPSLRPSEGCEPQMYRGSPSVPEPVMGTTGPATSETGRLSRKEKRKASSKARRSLKSAKEAAESAKHLLPRMYRPTRSALNKACRVISLKARLNSCKLPISGGGAWIGRRSTPLKMSPWTMDELVSDGFKLITWQDEGPPQAFLDQDDRIFAVIVGQPKSSDWSIVVDGLSEEMAYARQKGIADGVFESGSRHRRGKFACLADGVSFGGGQKMPGNLAKTAKERSLLDALKQGVNAQRVAGFQNAVFALYAPKLYKEYRDKLGKLYESLPDLRPNFPSRSVFPAATFNLGPDTVTLDHTDLNNVAYGLCAITALGNYDHTKGGHLILFDLKIILEFPAGATVLIPSGIMRHGNTPIVTGSRMSFTQYCAGGLFRWVEYGFQTAKSLESTEKGRIRKMEIDGRPGERAERARQLFSKFDSLSQDRVDILYASH